MERPVADGLLSSDLGADEIVDQWFDAVSHFGFCPFGSDVTCHGSFTGVARIRI
jgi:hypothetical protein